MAYSATYKMDKSMEKGPLDSYTSYLQSELKLMVFEHACVEILIPLYGDTIATVLWLAG